jgi:hypothetical protein
MAFLQLDQNEWTNTDTIQEIDFVPGTGNYVVTFKSGTITEFSSDLAKKVLKKFLDQENLAFEKLSETGEAEHNMSAQIQIEMTYWRDVYSGSACLEYSWVPEGRRRTILLEKGQQEGRRSDPISSDLNPSHVQVYSLTNDLYSTSGWQFPPGPPHATPVVRALVQVFEQNMEVVGTVYYADGSIATQKQKLDEQPRKCPEIPSKISA